MGEFKFPLGTMKPNLADTKALGALPVITVQFDSAMVVTRDGFPCFDIILKPMHGPECDCGERFVISLPMVPDALHLSVAVRATIDNPEFTKAFCAELGLDVEAAARERGLIE